MVAIKKVTFREKLDNLANAKLDKCDMWKHFDDLDDAKKWALAQDKNLSYKFHFTGFHAYFEWQLIMC